LLLEQIIFNYPNANDRQICGSRKGFAGLLLEWLVIHHTNCGMELFADEVIADLLDGDLGTASFDGKTWSNPHHHGGPRRRALHQMAHDQVQETSVAQDVRRIREHPLVPKSIPIYGDVYDVRTGRLNEMKAPSEAGVAAA
jgi:carbonic anhydrase